MLVDGDVYEPETQEYLADLSKSGDIVCGGAFVGDFLPRLDKAARPGGLVHTFEPNPISLAATQYTIALNGLKNCILHGCGIGAAPGKLNLEIAKPNGSAMAARARIVPESVTGQTVEVSIQTLDQLIAEDRTISAIQLDIEGSELDAIKGAARMIGQNSPVIIVEAEKPRHQRKYLALFETMFPKHGYRLDNVMERNAIFLPTV